MRDRPRVSRNGGKREKDSRSVNWVGDADIVRDIRENRLSVLLNVVDDSLVVSDHEDTAVRESKDSSMYS